MPECGERTDNLFPRMDMMSSAGDNGFAEALVVIRELFNVVMLAD